MTRGILQIYIYGALVIQLQAPKVFSKLNAIAEIKRDEKWNDNG